jgi:hypothetical protein
MRDNDHVRRYAPALLRVIIVVAVIAAVPVVLWAITAFVSSYVGPPRLPTFRPMVATPSTDDHADVTAAESHATRALRKALQAKAAPPLATLAEANAAAATAADEPIADAGKPIAGARSRNGEENAPTEPEPPAVVTTAASQRPLVARAATPVQAAVGTGGSLWPVRAAPMSSQPSASAKGDKLVARAAPRRLSQWPAPSAENSATPQPSASDDAGLEPILPGEPFAGPVPLPPQRPRTFAMATAPMPLPRPRPANAPPEAAPASDKARVPWRYNPGSIQ